MRIVFLAYQGSIHTRRWVSYFADRRHDVHVITCGGTEQRGSRSVASESGATTYRVHDLGIPRPAKVGYFLKARRVRRLVRQIEPDVVHAHFATSYGMLGLAARHHPLVVTAHGDDVLIAPRQAHLRPIVMRVLRSADAITVPSPYMAQAVQELLNGECPPIEAFQYGVESTELARRGDDIRAADPTDHDHMLRLVSTRAMLDLYRIDDLLDACALLSRRGVRFHLDLAGDGPQRSHLERRARELGIGPNVTFHGHVPIDRLEYLVAQANVYVSVAESDGVSLSLLEAMALGAVPVVSNIPANTDWVSDGHGGAVTEINPEAIADAISRAAALDIDDVRAANRSIVAERGDYMTNMGLAELVLDDVSGVRFEADAKSRSRNDEDAA